MSRAHDSGFILIVALVVGGILVGTAGALVGYTNLNARSSRIEIASVQSRALAEAGIEMAVDELNQNPSYGGASGVAIGEGEIAISIENISANTKRIAARAAVPSLSDPRAETTIKTTVSIDTSVVAFNFGVQSGDGGLHMQNYSSVRGNIFSNGPVTGANNNIVRGTVLSAGPSGLVDNVNATSSAYAHTIQNATIGGDAFYQSIANSSVEGTLYPDSPDQSTSTLPISDEVIEEWKAVALAGGTYASPCPYEIASSTTLGPIKIDCDLIIKGTNHTVTLAGHVWVNGDITIQNSPTIRVDPALGANSVALIADDESDPTGGGLISLQNSSVFEGSGSPGSYVLLLSQNRSAEDGGLAKAIQLANSSGGGALLAYAGHGEIELSNAIGLNEVTAWRIVIKNSAEVVYKTGLANSFFSSGPGGSWAVIPGSYAIVE